VQQFVGARAHTPFSAAVLGKTEELSLGGSIGAPVLGGVYSTGYQDPVTGEIVYDDVYGDREYLLDAAGREILDGAFGGVDGVARLSAGAVQSVYQSTPTGVGVWARVAVAMGQQLPFHLVDQADVSGIIGVDDVLRVEPIK